MQVYGYQWDLLYRTVYCEYDACLMATNCSARGKITETLLSRKLTLMDAKWHIHFSNYLQKHSFLYQFFLPFSFPSYLPFDLYDFCSCKIIIFILILLMLLCFVFFLGISILIQVALKHSPLFIYHYVTERHIIIIWSYSLRKYLKTFNRL